MKNRPLWQVHLADELAVLVEQQLAEDVEWALKQGFDSDAIRQAGQVATDTHLTLRQALEQDFSDLQLVDEAEWARAQGIPAGRIAQAARRAHKEGRSLRDVLEQRRERR